MRLRFTRLSEAAVAPARAHDDDAGLDLHAAEAASLAPGERVSVGTGVAVAIPAGCAGLVLPRSGLAARHGITILNTPGLVDAGYRGEVQVALHNTDRRESFVVEVGMRIAQLVVQAIPAVTPVAVDHLPESARGASGFGSSGA